MTEKQRVEKLVEYLNKSITSAWQNGLMETAIALTSTKGYIQGLFNEEVL